MQVIGAGWGRTGTSSLKQALEILGFGPCYHMSELSQRPQDLPYWEQALKGELQDWGKIFRGYRSTVDWPGCAFYESLLQAYPQAKVILTVRDAQSWYESVCRTIYRRRQRAARSLLAWLLYYFERKLIACEWPLTKFRSKLIWQGTFAGRFEEKSVAIEAFYRHIAHVRRSVPTERLLIYQVKDGWEPLCRFLACDVPQKQSFPHLNTTEQFWKPS
ncbi:sulfotransferase family protein [Ktedonosporobacter rubrisoli]|uniref:Sulfotransferase family protein n=1 Tax=Ktedonosporobacter rubrisoli TaxID=2509675 RepID=A0A4V0Z0I7_KTERU|nr:sulfotransferase family protein [Ktedonosporobacter rubrisoli]